MRTLFERVDYFIDRLLGEKGCTFLTSMGRYIVSLFSIALFTICMAHFMVHGHPWNIHREAGHASETAAQLNPGLEEFGKAMVFASRSC